MHLLLVPYTVAEQQTTWWCSIWGVGTKGHIKHNFRPPWYKPPVNNSKEWRVLEHKEAEKHWEHRLKSAWKSFLKMMIAEKVVSREIQKTLTEIINVPKDQLRGHQYINWLKQCIKTIFFIVTRESKKLDGQIRQLEVNVLNLLIASVTFQGTFPFHCQNCKSCLLNCGFQFIRLLTASSSILYSSSSPIAHSSQFLRCA